MLKYILTITPLVLIIWTSEAQSLKTSSRITGISSRVIQKTNEKLLDNQELSVISPNLDRTSTSSQELQTTSGLLDNAKKKQIEELASQNDKIEKVEKELGESANLRDMPLTEEERSQLMIGKTARIQVEHLEDVEEDSVYVLLDTEPSFVGGKNALNQFLSTKLTYPKKPTKNLTGNVYVRFLVTKTGKIDKVHVAKGLGDNAYNIEAIKAVKQMPDWKPATVAGKSVSSYCIYPITFIAN